jgi:hypothetical protein
LIELAAKFLEAFRSDGNADIDGGLLLLLGFVAIDGRMKASGDGAKDIETYTDGVSVLWGNGLLKVESLLDQELGLSFASFTPQIGKAIFIIAAPGIEVSIWGQFWIGAEKLKERRVRGAEEFEKALGNFRRKRLFSAWRPGRLPRRFWTLFEFGQCGAHSELKAIGW